MLLPFPLLLMYAMGMLQKDPMSVARHRQHSALASETSGFLKVVQWLSLHQV